MFTTLLENRLDKMQLLKELDLNNDKFNEEPTDQLVFPLISKTSKTKSPKPSITGIFPSLCLLGN